MLAPPKRFVAFNIVVDINCEVSACVFRCGPLLSAGTASLKPVPASSSNASEYASSAQGNKEVYSSSPISAGSSDTCWDCAYSSHRKPLFPQESTVLRSKQPSQK